jgi:ATP-dependent RNA helicase SUPV3L1/SUV3
MTEFSPQSPSGGREPGNIVAVLGPTNTGKTYLAVERMLAHDSGMIGLPLRLLAREVYDRICGLRKPSEVALITGEERIVPKQARYYVCTVEAMPSDLDVAFLAIDEIQLAADLERGHIFTSRLMHRRGRSETMLLGAETMRPLVERLLPGINFIKRPRFSKLSYSGPKKITRLPGRAAIVAFNADNVYAIAELIRRQRGGAAVVMGALSPRTRNAQVALFQSGDVDFLVATDAIGMGLNMDVDHVAFAATNKFDGFSQRALRPAELAQIAGRAGRHLNDGTFGVTGDAPPLDAHSVEQIENHQFEPERVLQWRNHDLDYASLDGLAQSLNAVPERQGLARAPIAVDLVALEALAKDPDIRNLARAPAAIRRLWEVCQLPDYRKLASGEHIATIARIYRYLMSEEAVIPNDWLSKELAIVDRTDGDIDTLATRISHIRTWTFVANRADWTRSPGEWRDKTRGIEDKLSDALHEKLIQRFIDRRTSTLVKRLKQKEALVSTMSADGAVFAEDQYLGRLRGFRFVHDANETGPAKALRAAALKVVARELEKRADEFCAASDEQFAIENADTITWHGHAVARLEAGDHALRPRAVLLADDQLSGPSRKSAQARLDAYLAGKISADLEMLVALDAAGDLTGLARGVAFRLVEKFGILRRDEVADDVRQLDQDVRKTMRRYGIRFGTYHIYLPQILKPQAAGTALVLWALSARSKGAKIAKLPDPPGQGLTSVPFDRNMPHGFYEACGFMPCRKRAVRIDMLERLADLIRPRIFWKPDADNTQRPEGSVEGGGFTVIPDMMSLVGCSGEEFEAVLTTLGYRAQTRKSNVVANGPVPADRPAPADQATTSPDDGAAKIDDKAETVPPAQDTQTPATLPENEPTADTGTKQQAEQHEAPANSGGSVKTADGDASAPEPPAVIKIWLPRRAQSTKRTHKKAGARPVPGTAKHASPRKAGKRPDKPKPKSRKPVQKPDKDSPFAALASLRKNMTGPRGD